MPCTQDAPYTQCLIIHCISHTSIGGFITTCTCLCVCVCICACVCVCVCVLICSWYTTTQHHIGPLHPQISFEERWRERKKESQGRDLNLFPTTILYAHILIMFKCIMLYLPGEFRYTLAVTVCVNMSVNLCEGEGKCMCIRMYVCVWVCVQVCVNVCVCVCVSVSDIWGYPVGL